MVSIKRATSQKVSVSAMNPLMVKPYSKSSCVWNALLTAEKHLSRTEKLPFFEATPSSLSGCWQSRYTSPLTVALSVLKTQSLP